MVEVLFFIWLVITALLIIVFFGTTCAYLQEKGFSDLRELRGIIWFLLLCITFWPLIVPSILILFLFGYNFGQRGDG